MMSLNKTESCDKKTFRSQHTNFILTYTNDSGLDKEERIKIKFIFYFTLGKNWIGMTR